MLILALSAVVGAGTVAAWLIDRARCRRRNARGACAACGVAWAEIPAGAPYLIQGRLVCEGCATTARRRLLWHFGILTAAVVVAMGFIVSVKGLAAMVLFPAATAAVMTVGAVRLMKRANYEAQRKIAAGEFPDFRLLGTHATADAAFPSVAGTADDRQSGGREIASDRSGGTSAHSERTTK